MKLLIGAIAYLSAVAAIVVAAIAGVASVEPRAAEESPVLAMETETRDARRARAIEEMPEDPNRVPVWIAPTAKYVYTPQPIEPRPKRTSVIGTEARGAMARAPEPRRKRERTTETAPPRGVTYSRRDNDPFHRD